MTGDFEPRPDPEFEAYLSRFRAALWVGLGIFVFLMWLGALLGWY